MQRSGGLEKCKKVIRFWMFGHNLYLTFLKENAMTMCLVLFLCLWWLGCSLSSRCWEMVLVGFISAWESGALAARKANSEPGIAAWTSLLFQPVQPSSQTSRFLLMMGIGKNTTSKSMEAGSSSEGKYEDEAKHPAFFTLPVTAGPASSLLGSL